MPLPVLASAFVPKLPKLNTWEENQKYFFLFSFCLFLEFLCLSKHDSHKTYQVLEDELCGIW